MDTILVLIEGHDEQKPVVRGLGAERLAGPHGAYRAALDDETEIVVVISGVGPKRANRIALECIERFSPSLIVSAGTCGALTGEMEMSDWLVTGAVRSLGGADDAGRSSLDTLESSAADSISRLSLGLAATTRVHRGMLVTVSDKPIVEAREKSQIASRHDAVAVDMESYGIARAAADHNIPWLVARVVVDTPAHPLPELGPMNVRTGRPPLAGIAKYVLANPVSGPRVLHRLWALVNEYARTLVRNVGSLSRSGSSEEMTA